jgi:hypothetical protein
MGLTRLDVRYDPKRTFPPRKLLSAKASSPIDQTGDHGTDGGEEGPPQISDNGDFAPPGPAALGLHHQTNETPPPSSTRRSLARRGVASRRCVPTRRAMQPPPLARPSAVLYETRKYTHHLVSLRFSSYNNPANGGANRMIFEHNLLCGPLTCEKFFRSSTAQLFCDPKSQKSRGRRD